MELTAHPLLTLVESNANGLKLLLKNYIDFTVDNQFDQLKNSIVKMIATGQIGPQSNDSTSEYTQTTFASGQSNNIKNASILHNSNDSLVNKHDQIACPPTNQLQTFTKQSNNNLINHNEDEEDCEKFISEIKKEVDETADQIEQINQDDEESSLPVKKQKLDTTQPLNRQSQVKGQCPIETKQVHSQIQTDEPVNNQQSIPSTSGRRSSDRKRIQRKMFVDDDQSNGQVKSGKRKNSTNSRKVVKKMKHQEVINQEEEEEEVDDDEVANEVHEVETKLQIMTLELNCTEPGCKRILNSFEMWKQHLTSFHDQMPYKQLEDNVRHNQHGEIEYPCTECEVEFTSQVSLNRHWRNFHLRGKFECSACEFVGNFRCEVVNHQLIHRSRKFHCTHQGCDKTFRNNHYLEAHQRVHNGERPFACTWDSCQLTFKKHSHAIRHVRTRHFRLPGSVKEQKELNIIDKRDPKVYVQVL